MKVGILYNSNVATWQSGANVFALHLYKLMMELGYSATLILYGSSDSGFISIKSAVKSNAGNTPYSNFSSIKSLTKY